MALTALQAVNETRAIYSGHYVHCTGESVVYFAGGSVGYFDIAVYESESDFLADMGGCGNDRIIQVDRFGVIKNEVDCEDGKR